MNRSWISMLAGACLVGVASSCARTAMFSRRPLAPAHAAFRRVVVIALLTDAELRAQMERRVATHAVPGRFAFLLGDDVFGLRSASTPDDTAALLRANAVDATLYIVPGAVGSDSGRTPPTVQYICAAPNPDGTCTTIPMSMDGVPYRRPWARFAAVLIDARSRAVVWIADATTDGSEYADAATLVRSMADRTVRQLTDDGLLR